MPDHQLERSEIIRLSRALLLGPLADDEEIPSPPADTYLTGILWPEGVPLASIEDDQQDGAPANEDGETDAGVPGYRTVRPCSIGLTFAADADATVVVSLAATSRYLSVEQETPEGQLPDRHWRRVPLNYSYEIPTGGPPAWRTHYFLDPAGTTVHDPDLCLHIRRRVDDMPASHHCYSD